MIDHDAYEAAERQRREQIEAERLAYAKRMRSANRNDRGARLDAAFLNLNDARRLHAEGRR